MRYKAYNTMDITAQIAEFRTIAKANYNSGMGWQTFTECFDEADIREFIDLLDGEDLENAMSETAAIWQDGHDDAAQYREDAY